MTYLKVILSAVAAGLFALMVPGVYFLFWSVRSQTVTGLAGVAGGLSETLLSPLFWILAIVLFLLFFAASRLPAAALRIRFFWTPAAVASALSLLLVASYGWMVSSQG
jgi:hypothetical protein